MNVREPLLLTLGAAMLVVAVIHFIGSPVLIKWRYRDLPNLKPYMRRQAYLYAIVGIAAIIYSLPEEDPVIGNKLVAVVFALIIVIAMVCIGFSSRSFMNQAEAEKASAENTKDSKGEKE